MIVALGVLAVLVMQRVGVRHPFLYVGPGIVVWGGMLHAGIHPTIAGVLLAFTIPIRQKKIFLEENLRMLVNPGSVGQPRDNDPRSSFAWWDRVEGTLNFERVEYDNLAAREDILEAGLPRILGDRLLEGR